MKLNTTKETTMKLDILEKVQRGEMTAEEAVKLLSKPNPVKFKVSDKGAISVYMSNRRFPVTLYAGEWEQVIEGLDGLKKFIVDNEDKLSRK